MEVYYARLLLVGLGVLLIPFVFSHLFAWLILPGTSGSIKNARVPRTLPYNFPLLKSTIPFTFDGHYFFRYASRYCGDQSTIRIALLKDDLYLVQGAKNVAEVFRTSSLTVTLAYGIVLKYCFGMADKAANTYVTDTSGSQFKPIAGSNVQRQGRVSHQTHENLLKGLLGTGLKPATGRFESTFTKSLCSLNISQQWTYFPDLPEFFEDHVGSAVVKAIFGSALLSLNPDFLRDLWAYDKEVMSLARRLPAFWIPGAYKLRNKLLLSIRRWHDYARAHHDELDEFQDVDVDPIWGCRMMRDRYKMLLGIENQDYDSVASTDLAFIWATVTNVVPSSMTLVLQVLLDGPLLLEIRQCLAETVKTGTHVKFDLKKLDQQPLLSSVYAETLRFGVQIHIPRCAPHKDLSIGSMLIPKNRLILVNTWLAHTDEAVWNTKKEAFPLNTFWPQRFLVDSKDPSSGPSQRSHEYKSLENNVNSAEDPRFSTEGLEGAWIPFGGGHHACPGRVLAKRIMLLSCATITNMFDMEVLADDKALEYGSPRFGFGVRRPTGRVPFRLRRRRIE